MTATTPPGYTRRGRSPESEGRRKGARRVGVPGLHPIRGLRALRGVAASENSIKATNNIHVYMLLCDILDLLTMFTILGILSTVWLLLCLLLCLARLKIKARGVYLNTSIPSIYLYACYRICERA